MDNVHLEIPHAVNSVNPDLYILAFKDEPLVKVGFSEDVYTRALTLGSDRFDFASSYRVLSSERSAAGILERNLKLFFAEHQVPPVTPLNSGNTETFKASVLPEMLDFIRTLQSRFPNAGLKIEKDISALNKPVPASLKRRHLPINYKLAAVESLLPSMRVEKLVVRQDDDEDFNCVLFAQEGQREKLRELWELAHMPFPDCWLWGLDRLDGPSGCVDFIFRMFYRECLLQNFPDGSPDRLLNMIRRFAAQHTYSPAT